MVFGERGDIKGPKHSTEPKPINPNYLPIIKRISKNYRLNFSDKSIYSQIYILIIFIDHQTQAQ